MRALCFAALLLAGCGKPQVINLGQKADGSPRARIWLDPAAKREDRAARQAAVPALPQAIPGTPVSVRNEVYEGPITVGLRLDGSCVVAGKSVRDEEVQARLTYVRGERKGQSGPETDTVTVLAESDVPMDRVMRAMSGGHQAGFSKIGWQRVDAVLLPAPEPFAASLPSDEGRLVVSVQADGSYRLGAESLEAVALGVRLGEASASRRAQGLPPPAVTVLADRDAPLAAVKDALGACEAAGVQSVALGSPVPVVSSSPVLVAGIHPEEVDISEAYRNWRLGLEDRDVDFSEGPPAYWYFQLYHAVLEELDFLQEALKDRILNTERVRYYARKAATHLGQMGSLLGAVEAGRGEALSALSADVGKLGEEVWAGRLNLDLARMRLKGHRDRVNAEFPPAQAVFPADLKIPPPDQTDPVKETLP